MKFIAVIAAAGLGLAAVEPTMGEVKVEKVAYMNLPNCYRLSNGSVEVIVTTDVGPRIIRYGFPGGQNLLAEMPDAVVKTDFGDWKPWGGHRLWHAPEVIPRTYSPDNTPIEFKKLGTNGIQLIQPVEPKTGILKEMTVTLDEAGSGVTILHKLTNKGVWPTELAPWALTIMAGGGVTIIPQEPFKSHDDYVLPARAMVMWHYTDLSDPRWTLGKKYLRLKTDENLAEPQKIGMANKQGWAGYAFNKQLFVKRFPYVEGARYPDYGCNCETYTAGTFMEVETLGPLQNLEPGQTAEHTERWYLFKNVDIGASEEALDAAITPLVAQTRPK